MEDKKYNVRELTPDNMGCPVGGCPGIYEVTPEDMKCGFGACPSIYEVTPENEKCRVGACPSIHDFENDYLIVGKKVDPKRVGLEKKVGENEVLIKISKKIIDGAIKSKVE